jgi:hypothetical protein
VRERHSLEADPPGDRRRDQKTLSLTLKALERDG